MMLQGMQKEKMRQRTKVHKAGDLSALHEDVGTEVVQQDIPVFFCRYYCCLQDIRIIVSSLLFLLFTQMTSHNYCHRFSQLSMEAQMAL